MGQRKEPYGVRYRTRCRRGAVQACAGSVKYFWNFGNLYGQNTENPDLDSVVNDILHVDKNNVGGIAATVTVLF